MPKPESEGARHSADLEQQDPKTQALFRLIFAVYERQDRLADRLENVVAVLQGAAGVFLSNAPPFIQQAHGRAKMKRYLHQKTTEGQR